MKPLALHDTVMKWWDRQDWIMSPFSWMPEIALSLVMLPVSLIDWFIRDLWDAKKDRARVRGDIK